MNRFSLNSVLLVVAIIALLISHFRTSIQLRDAQREIREARANYGYLDVKDDTKINVVSLSNEKRHDGDALRFIIPPGERYFLHLSEVTSTTISGVPSERPKITYSLGWKDGADIIVRYEMLIDVGPYTPYMEAAANNRRCFTYRPEEWPEEVYFDTVHQFDATEPKEIELGQPVFLYRGLAPSIDRGIVLWLEPESHRSRRRAATD
jgi:hypothetical protein